jgi:dihydroorotate dehydrogenase
MTPMGLYRAVGRPLFFGLNPESAHRLAGWLLRLPLPWSRIGGAIEDPSLRTDLAGIPLRNPVGLAAGFDKSCRFLPALGDLGFGYLVAGTVTRRPRGGNPKPRIVRRPEVRSMVNAMGLPNKGAEFAADRLHERRRTAPVIVSVADEGRHDVLVCHALLEPLADGIELNVSCPNVTWGRDRDNEEHLRVLLRELAARRSKPLFVKLPPFQTEPEREAVLALAAIAQEGGADGLTYANTRAVPEPRLAVSTGGLSGRALFDGTAAGVEELRRRWGPGPAINACGGIFSAADALACLDAGATTVQIYTGLIYEGPRILRSITGGIAAALRERRKEPRALSA